VIAPVGGHPESVRASRIDWIALSAVAVVAFLLRLLYLGQPIRHDEAYSYLYFALPSLRTAMSDYSVPNNHIFHTVLVWASTRMFGDSVEVIRLPVLIAGVLSVPAAWLAARALAGRGAAIFAAAMVAVLPSLILYSTNARAYMLVCLATLLLVWLGNRLLDAESAGLWVAIVILGALEMWAAPVMLYPLGAVALWLVAEHARTEGVRGAVRFLPRLGAATAAIGVLTVMLYLPVILRGQGRLLLQNRFVSPMNLAELDAQLIGFARGLRELIGLGLPRIEIMIALLVALVGIVAPGPQRMRRVTLVAATACWCCALMLATRRLPPARVFLFIAPIWCLCIGAGLSRIAERLHAERVSAQFVGALLVLTLLAAQVVRSRAVLESEETDWIGMRDARDIAALIVASPADDRVVINRSIGPPLDYYLYHLTGRRLATFMDSTHRGRVLLVLDERHGQTLQRVLPVHPDIPWGAFGQPTLLRRFPGASVYAFAAK
jgi:uncharacterized membrane protein